MLLSLVVSACSSSDGGADGPGSSAAAGAATEGDGSGGPASGSTADYTLTQQVDMSIELTSSVFSRIRRIPLRHTCTTMKDIARPTTDPIRKVSENLSPPLAWGGLPDGTVSIALIFEGTDELVDPKNEEEEPLAVHWVIWNIPADVTELAEAVATTTNVLAIGPNVTQGLNVDGVTGYTGPCPPLQAAYSIGRQGYYGQKARPVDQFSFKIYALDIELDLGPEATVGDLLRRLPGVEVADDGSITAQGEEVQNVLNRNLKHLVHHIDIIKTLLGDARAATR